MGVSWKELQDKDEKGSSEESGQLSDDVGGEEVYDSSYEEKRGKSRKAIEVTDGGFYKDSGDGG